jgi:hypothetical protein
MANPTELMLGDHIEIRYRVGASLASDDEQRDKWIAAEVKSVDGGVWPLVRLADGPLTEVRRYMEWRYASSHIRRPLPHPRSA